MRKPFGLSRFPASREWQREKIGGGRYYKQTLTTRGNEESPDGATLQSHFVRQLPLAGTLKEHSLCSDCYPTSSHLPRCGRLPPLLRGGAEPSAKRWGLTRQCRMNNPSVSLRSTASLGRDAKGNTLCSS